MKKNKILSIAIALTAILAAAVLGIRIGFFRETFTPAETRKQAAISQSCAAVDEFFRAFSAGDAQTVEALTENYSIAAGMYTGELGELARSSFSYQILSSQVIKNEGVANTVSVTWLDAAALTESMEEEIQQILNQELEEAASSAEIYDQELNFRQDVLDRVFAQVLAGRMENAEAYLRTDTVVIQTTMDTPPKLILSEALCNILANGRTDESK